MNMIHEPFLGSGLCDNVVLIIGGLVGTQEYYYLNLVYFSKVNVAFRRDLVFFQAFSRRNISSSVTLKHLES